MLTIVFIFVLNVHSFKFKQTLDRERESPAKHIRSDRHPTDTRAQQKDSASAAAAARTLAHTSLLAMMSYLCVIYAGHPMRVPLTTVPSRQKAVFIVFTADRRESGSDIRLSISHNTTVTFDGCACTLLRCSGRRRRARDDRPGHCGGSLLSNLWKGNVKCAF